VQGGIRYIYFCGVLLYDKISILTEGELPAEKIKTAFVSPLAGSIAY